MLLIYFFTKFYFAKITNGVEKSLNQEGRHGDEVSRRKMAMSSYLTSYGKGKELLMMLRLRKESLSVQSGVWAGTCKEGQ